MTALTIDDAQESAEIAALVDALAAAGWPEGLAAERAAMEAEATPLAPDIAATAMQLAGRPAERLVGPAGGAAGTCLYLHGGGYVYGSLLSHRGLIGELARATDLRMIQLDYRLAPEHPFPAAIEDAVAAVRALYDSGVQSQDFVLMGDSAGGGLTLATLLALRDSGTAMPRAAVVLSPWTDLSCSGKAIAAVGRSTR
ncbi:alpha/beta hydrolase fold domain-containing protein [Sphingomonas sp. MMS24-J45]|uniref:alpha/beta hydrolase fold domain-containing protein n=1 Tax=Sphingomonas sp. MMS24-J45 TaxID=3238806 RepID=UPI00384C0B4F